MTTSEIITCTCCFVRLQKYSLGRSTQRKISKVAFHYFIFAQMEFIIIIIMITVQQMHVEIIYFAFYFIFIFFLNFT